MPLRHDVADFIENIVRLRRAENLASPELRPEIASVRTFLETLVGSTISRAEAARVLGISQPALDKWISKGEISSVLTPQDRREVPLAEVVGLLDDVQRARQEQRGRPLTWVLRERARSAREEIDVDRLLPKRKPRTHRIAELQSLAYHRLVAERLNDSIVDAARGRLRRWNQEGRLHPHWAEEWEHILSMPVSQVRAAISADSSVARELRQTSPFTDVLTEQERVALHRAVEARLRG